MYNRGEGSLKMKDLILLRGLPGSGKSTLAKVLSEGKHPVYSVDDYFTDQSGNYDFRFAENHIAYKNCAENTELAMQKEVLKIFIDNAFTLEWEMEPYFKLASIYNYRVFVVTVEKRHDGENIHGVTEEQLQKMAEKYMVRLR
jgi:predicted kinase